MLNRALTKVITCDIGDSNNYISLLIHCIMKAYKKSKKSKIPGKTDDCRARSDGLRILARIIARSYGKQSLPQETKTVIASDNPSHDQQIA